MKIKELKLLLNKLNDNDEINLKFITRVECEKEELIKIDEDNKLLIQMETFDIECLASSIGIEID